ncbi:MAG: hypothetical protein LBV42_01625 [Methanobrevibacter sp.]|jgi:hypothetical protein|nr:hypothetical protein [Methanobrevibacter sp.]
MKSYYDDNKNKLANINIEVIDSKGIISKGITKTFNIGGVFLNHPILELKLISIPYDYASKTV